MKRLAALLGACLLLALAQSAWAAPRIDLRDVTAGQVRQLHGEWQLDWIQPQREAQRVQLPFLWRDGSATPWGEVGFGRIELSAELLLPAGDEPLALYVDDIKSAARVWIDDRLVLRRGTPGDAAEEVPRLTSMVIPLPVGEPVARLRIEISNHFHHEGGIDMPLLVGPRALLDRREAQTQGFYVFILGGCLLMATYLLLLGRWNDSQMLTGPFSLMLLLAATRAAASGEVLDNVFDLSALWVYRLEYLCPMLYPAFYALLLRRLFPQESHRLISRGLLIVGLALALLVLLSPVALFSLLRNPSALLLALASLYFIGCILLAVRRRRVGALSILIGMLVVSASVLNDILLHVGGVLTVNLFPLGTLALLLSHGVVLGQRVLASLRQNRELSANLQRLNADLERRVEARTEGLRKSRDLLDNTLAHVQTAVLSVDRDGQVTALNAPFLALFGIAGQPVDMHQLFDALQQADMALSQAERHALVPSPGHAWGAAQSLQLDNRRIIRVAGRGLQDGGWVATYTDVTAQHLAEQRSKGGGICHWTLELGSHRLRVSERCWALLGYALVPALVEQSTAWLHAEDQPRLRSALRAALRGDGELLVEVRLRCADGRWLWVSLRGRCILGHAGRPVSWVGAVEDIDGEWRSRQAQERAREQAQREARQTAELFSFLSHELRTPLVAIHGYLTLLEADARDQRMRERLATVLTAAASLTDILDGLAALARAEGAKLPPDVPFDIHALLEQSIALLQPQATAKQLRIELATDPALPRHVLGSPMVLRQVLNNLLSNAVKFSEGGLVRVALEALGEQGEQGLVLSVRDSGPGIAADRQDNIFDAFVRLEEHRDLPGSGLGLYIVRRLVDLSGGRVEMQSTPGAGVCVRVELPWSALQVSAPVTGSGSLDGLQILLVDDIEVNLDVTRELLMRWGAKVGTASSGAAALARCRQEDYDLVLMDMRMPDMDGIAASRAIRQLNPHGGPLIVALTANAAQLDRDACRAAGIDGALFKPLQLPSLLRIWRGEDGLADIQAAEPDAADGVSSLRLAQLQDWLGAEACERLLPMLIASLGEVREQLQALQTETADSELGALLHRLRGSAMNFGLRSLAADAARVNTLDELPALLAALDEHLALLHGWSLDVRH